MKSSVFNIAIRCRRDLFPFPRRGSFRLALLELIARISQSPRFICRSTSERAVTSGGSGERLEERRVRARAAALSTFAFSVRTHAILLIVSGSFVLETSSSCGLVVPMRALPRPMGWHRVPLVFAVDVAVAVVSHRRRRRSRPPPSSSASPRRLRQDLLVSSRERRGTRTRASATLQKR